MKTLQTAVSCLLEIKKSRFIGCVEPINSHEEGMARVLQLRQQHPDAAHVCFSMLAKGQVRQSDDGEPSGTAAAPMLNVLQHKELDNVLATVVRYYGGIKLGAGGLVRAYSQAVNDAIAQGEFIELRILAKQNIQFDFEFESSLRRMADNHKVQLAIEYGERIKAELEGEQAALDSLIQEFTEHCRGRVVVLTN